MAQGWRVKGLLQGINLSLTQNLLELAGWSLPQEAEKGFCGKDSGRSWHLSGNWRETQRIGCNFKMVSTDLKELHEMVLEKGPFASLHVFVF